MTLGRILALLRQTAVDPREGAEAALALGWPREALFLALAALIALSTCLTVALSLIAPPPELQLPEDAAGAGAMAGPMMPIFVAAFAFALTAIYAWALALAGRVIGGTGEFDEALALVVLLQALGLAAQVVQVVVTLVLPVLAGLYFIGIALWFFWLSIVFTDVLHGFRSYIKSFALLFMVMTLLVLGGVVMLGLFGGTGAV